MPQQKHSSPAQPQRASLLACALAGVVFATCAAFVLGSTLGGATVHAQSPLSPATITVTSTDDDGPGSLRAAIAQAAPGATINFAFKGGIALTSAQLTINKDLTIVGPGIDELVVFRDGRTQYFRIFAVAKGATVNISGLLILGGRAIAPADDTGGGIKNNGTLTLDSCELLANFANEGGGLHNAGTLVLNHSKVDFNLSEGAGGGIANDGLLTINESVIMGNTGGNNIDAPGAGIINRGALTINNSTLTSNYLATGGDSAGGGIANSGRLTVNNSTFTYNFARTFGGALYNTGRAIINNSTFVKNSCGAGQHPTTARGGAIYNDDGDLSINACTITANQAEADGSTAGGVYNDSGTVTVATSIIAANHANSSGIMDVQGAFVSQGYNLIGVADGSTGFTNGVQHDQTGRADAPLDPGVGGIRNYGGPTETAPLLCGSPAIDAGDDSITGPPLNLTSDQRGRARRAGGHVDIGAFEVQPEEAQCPTLSISDVRPIEGDIGTSNIDFTITLSAPTTDDPVTFRYSTASGTAEDNVDYTHVSGFATIRPGLTSLTISVPIIGERLVEPDETFTLNLSEVRNAIPTRTQATGTILDDDAPAIFQFSAPTYQVSEGGGSVLITINRTGNLIRQAEIKLATIDEAHGLPCADTTTLPNVAAERCDYTTTIETLTFYEGLSEHERTIVVPIIDDARPEQPETFKVVLTARDGATIGPLNQATVTITDNDTGAGANPIDDNSFFVRQHYLDFLNREPEQAGFDAWTGLLSRCADRFNVDPASPSAACDRIAVSAAFFNSPEFRQKGYFIYRYYRVAFGRRPHYDEIVEDIRSVSGRDLVDAQVRRGRFPFALVARPEFRARFDGLDNTAFVDTLLGPYGVRSITTPDPQAPEGHGIVTFTRDILIISLNENFISRTTVLRAIAESREVDAAEFNGAFVTMQYFGYLRRDAEPAGFQAWLNYLNAHPTDYRTMVNGFLNSQEYRLRFGAR